MNVSKSAHQSPSPIYLQGQLEPGHSGQDANWVAGVRSQKEIELQQESLRVVTQGTRSQSPRGNGKIQILEGRKQKTPH